MKTFAVKKATLILVLLILAGVGLFAAYQAVVEWPARQIIHAYMDAKGIDIRPGTQEYKLFMRRIVWGEFPELRQISDFVKTQEELDAVSWYAFKYSGYQKLYGKYREPDIPEAKAPPASPTAGQMPSLVMPTATTLEETPLSLGTPSPTVPKATTTPKPKPTEIIYLTAMGPIDVYRAPDFRFEIIRQIPAGQTLVVFGRIGDWYWIDLGNGKTGWIYGVTNLLQLTVE